jgi:SET domain
MGPPTARSLTRARKLAPLSTRRVTRSSSQSATHATNGATTEHRLALTKIAPAGDDIPGDGLHAAENIERGCVVAEMLNPTIYTAEQFDAKIVAEYVGPNQVYHGIPLQDNFFAFNGLDECGHYTEMILFDHWGIKQGAERPNWTYLNHAIQSKTNVTLRRCMKNGRMEVRFVATKRILKDKQIFLYYGKNPEFHK